VSLSNPLMVICNCLSHLAPMVLVTIGCVIYLLKTRKFIGIALLIGNLLTIFVNIASAILIFMANSKMSSEIYSRHAVELQTGSILGTLMFGVGFLIMVFDMERKKDIPAPGAS
jgi:hypothetical protein